LGEGRKQAGWRGHWVVWATLVLLAIVLTLLLGGTAPAADGCTLSAVACENQLPGSPSAEWDINGAGDPSIQGFATDISVDHGETIHFKIDTNAAAYSIDIYRLGWYGGLGARQVATVAPSAPLPQSQPGCLRDASTGLVDCGNWQESAHWDVPASAVSGVYIAKLTRMDTGGASHIIFVVRDDESHSSLLYQTSDETWEAYNRYGGNSLYYGAPVGRAYKVSYNRPFTTREDSNPSWIFTQEIPMIRWLERNGYDVSYATGVDTARRGSALLDHKAFLSVGHDEYWSAEQRSNVEAARDAGVNLAFFSGNEMFWKTRWEPSIDGSGANWRTIVCYKETAANSKIDPTSTWTGTWRDKRFSPPGDGGRPENAVTGTLFDVNSYRSDAMTVSQSYGQLRFWRNTSVATLGVGQVATMPAGVLGHEWDSDVDNGSRPVGLFDLAATTLNVQTLLKDNGNTYGSGTATQNPTMYRAASGALVFGAGTAQWSWGLDSTHDYYLSGQNYVPSDSRMQQATVNLFADMGVQPTTLQSDLVASSESTDTTAPTAQITSPGAGATVNSGTTITISGTAADTGGKVAGVEVSVDGGATWHPAAGTTQWSYAWTVAGLGNVTIESRAVDDSGNVGTPTSSGTVVVCPCNLWNGASQPSTAASNDGNSIEVGLKFRSQSTGYITGIRFYKGATNTGTHVVSLWTSSGSLLARATSTNETSTGWQDVALDQPVAVTAGATYVASYFAPNGHYPVDVLYFNSVDFVNAPLVAPSNGSIGGNGVYSYGSSSTFPTQSYSSSNYWVDVDFNSVKPPDTTPPTVTQRKPATDATGVDVGATSSATFSEAIDSATVNSSTVLLRTASGTSVSGTVAYDPSTRTASITPTAPLAYSTTYTVVFKGGASGIADLVGNRLSADETWQFTTTAMRACPCTLWPASAAPAITSSNDSQSVELGVRFRTDVDGWVTGIRFYKGSGNTGTHVGSLWSNSGALLARATFASESAGGWQDVDFAQAVHISAGTTYVASYHAPNGRYAVSLDYFTGSTYANTPLRALADSLDGANGVYLYSGTATFPTSTYRASNYWVDVDFSTQAPADTTPPTVTAATPANGATGVAANTVPTATFSEALDPATIDGAHITLTSGGSSVAASVAYDAPTRTATITPSAPLSFGATYTARVTGGTGGVTDTAGNALQADYTWSFSTRACPCSLWSAGTTPDRITSSDSNSVELGVKFQSEVAGYITGVRFYKSSSNTGTHTGSLWTSSGMLLAQGTFSNETASGWQQLTFPTPVSIAANTTYVASYHAPNGAYSLDAAYFSGRSVDNAPLHGPSTATPGGNGVYNYSSGASFPSNSWNATNYWVDVVFDLSAPADTTPPTVSAVSPTDGSQASVDVSPSVRFNEPLAPSTIDASHLTLRDSGGNPVSGSVSYDSASRTATIDPTAPLTYGTTYTATVKGGTGGVTDSAGNALAADYAWSFTTPTCPCTIWPANYVPARLSSSDDRPIELGVKFRSTVAGYIRGIRFYKGPSNIGTHVGSLWTASGTLLARVTFTNETASGWQQANFATPVAISANTTYIASYFAPNGGWSVDVDYFTPGPAVSPPLTALASSPGDANGLYLYTGAPSFPTNSYSGSNYSVDVVFAFTP
jgi:hypothetical protein